MKYIKWLLLFVPISLVVNVLHVNEAWVFLAVCLSIIPLAAVIGNATEQLSLYTGSKVGGLISATMSNIPELLIGFFAVKAGLHRMVMASLAGSIMGNILLVLGLSILLGGLRRKYQYFDKSTARSNFILLMFAAMSVIIPFALKYAIDGHGKESINSGLNAISFSIAVILLFTYVSGLVFSLVTHRNVFTRQEEREEKTEKPEWSLRYSIIVLALAAIFVAVESDMLVDTVGAVIRNYGLPEVFIGIILIPILGNVAENVSAIIMAVKNKVDICVEIAVGSSIQIALFVAPLLILTSFILGNPLIYVYDMFEIVAMVIGIGLSLFVFQDGKTNWLEGIVLLGCYILLGVAFFFI